MASAFRYEPSFSPRDDRQAVRMWATIEREGEAARDIVIHDLSVSGFAFESATDVAVGTAILVRVGGLPPLSATVVNRRDGDHGCRLAVPLDAATIDAVTRSGPFAVAPPARTAAADGRPSVPLRVAVLLGLGAASWSVVLGAGWLLFG